MKLAERDLKKFEKYYMKLGAADLFELYTLDLVVNYEDGKLK